MTKQTASQFRLLCAYCGEPGSSGEHYWPRWAHKQLGKMPPEMRPMGMLIKMSRTDSTIEPVMRRSGRTRLGDQSKRICVTCNGGWMSALTGRKDVLAPLFFDPPTVLSSAQREIIGRWAIMTAMTIDTLAEHSTVPQIERDAMRLGRPSPLWKVWIGRYVGGEWSARWARSGVTAKYGSTFLPQCYSCVFALGKACFLVVYNLTPSLNFLTKAHDVGLRGAWPPRPSDLDWASVREHTDEDLSSLEQLMNEAGIERVNQAKAPRQS